MKTITIGLIPAPGFPADIAAHLKEELPNVLGEYIDKEVTWEVEMTVDPLTGAAEYIDEVLHKATSLKKDHGWDYAICLTDLPIFANGHLVTADASIKNGVAQISLPSFGSMPIRRRIRKAIIQMTGELYYRSSTDDPFVETALDEKRLLKKDKQITNIYKNQFLFGGVKRISPSDKAREIDVRFILRFRTTGWLRVISGMTFANRPWTALFSFKQVLTLAFATGAYISIFPTPWELSLTYSIPRFILLTFIAIIGMVIWVIFSHDLWENSSEGNVQLCRLYNYTTITTLSTIVAVNYIALLVLFMIAVALFVPPNLFQAWTGLDEDPALTSYFRLVWFVTSLGTIAGAIGTGLQHEEKVRDITYSYRQKQRQYEIQKQDKENEEREIQGETS